MSTTPLNRTNLAARTGASAEAAPVRIAHFGLGAFHRAHQAWYTSAADPENAWGVRAFTGRSADAANTLAPQDGLFTLIERSADGDNMHVVSSIVDAVDGARFGAVASTIADPDVAVVTLTITEAGYNVNAQGKPDLEQASVASDIALLKAQFDGAHIEPGAVPRTALGRLVLGLEQRRRAGVGGIAIVSCDNLPGNGELTRVAVESLAALTHGADLETYIDENVSFVTTSIDRITPKTTDADIAEVTAQTGWIDNAPVVTEPFRDWVLSGSFPGGRPEWERAGAQFVDDIDPFERRKLWLLNGAHSLLAYAGPLRGHTTVADAIADPVLHDTVTQFWDEASAHLPAGLNLPSYREALLERFNNGRIQHFLAQIGQDGTQKLRVRTVPVLLAERAAGRDGAGAVQAIASWIAMGRDGRLPLDRTPLAPATSVSLEADVVRLLTHLDPALVADPAILRDVTHAVVALRG